MEAISFENFSMRYGENGFGLSNINLTINEGDFVVITGGTGSGKSTLMRQMKGEFVSHNYKGSLKVLGVEMRDAKPKDTLAVGYVMQFPREQIVTDKVFHELSFGLENIGLSTDEIRLRVSETAHYFGISNYMEKNTSELSGGEMQILNLASVMAMRPRILLLDEPTSQLDEVAADKLMSLVYRINRELGTTVIVVEHRLDMLERFTSVVIMDNGNIAYNGDKPTGYKELPIYMRVGEVLDKDIRSVTECREALQDAYDNGKITARRHKDEDIKCDKRDVVLKANNLWYRYSKADRDILKGLDIEICKGEILSVIGANGAGKSTLLTILAGARECYKGSIKRYGQKVIYIPQTLSFVTETVGKELDNAEKCYIDTFKSENKKNKDIARLALSKKAELDALRREYEEIFDIHAIKNSSPYEISGGERAKVAIMIALLSSPDILLLDEPTKGMDRTNKEIVKSILRRLVAIGKSVVLVSHDIELVGEISDKVATLFDGQILSICSPRILLSTNFFSTTTSRRIARGIIDDVLTEEELLEAVHYGQ